MQSRQVDTLYILSAGHSGSTLLNLILGSHPQAVAVSELTYWPANILHNEQCTCGSSVRECPFWLRVAERLHRRLGIDVMSKPLDLELGFRNAPGGRYRATPQYRASWKLRRYMMYASLLSGIALPRFARHRFDLGITNRLVMYDAVREVSHCPLVVDASKDYLQGISVYKHRPERTRLLLLVRDGRAVFYSNLKRGFGKPYSLRVWRNYYRHALPLLRQHVAPEHVLTVKYEDLAADTGREARRICELVGLGYTATMLDTTSKVHHITSGNDLRLKPITRITADTKWRSSLSPQDLGFFQRSAAALNRQLGYE